jgi:small subunit ribosomal protein S1
VENPREIVAQGEVVNVKIIEMDADRRRLSLSLKRVEPHDDVRPSIGPAYQSQIVADEEPPAEELSAEEADVEEPAAEDDGEPEASAEPAVEDEPAPEQEASPEGEQEAAPAAADAAEPGEAAPADGAPEES